MTFVLFTYYYIVIGTVGLVAIGGNLAAKRAREGSLSLPTMENTSSHAGARRRTESLRSQPLQKNTEVPEGPDDVDRITE